MLGISLIASVLAFAPPQEAPPGMVLVKGGKTKIGSQLDDVEELILARDALKNVLIAQTPQHTVDVKDFYLMPTEVTNEQYAVFVNATQAKPPRSWGDKTLREAQAAYLLEQGKAKQEAKAAGLPFESKIFEPESWWEDNWKDAAWEIPETELTNPVVFVTYAEAQAYARWAGVRLMTEFEFQRAARGDSTREFPWGDEWDDVKYCQSLHIGKDTTVPVGSFPEGGVNGVFDLAGNVWEWTSSPFLQYPGYKQMTFKIKKQNRTIECLAPFDPNQRVTVSGSYQMDQIGVRIATRMNTDRTQSTSALGFRCAASTSPGMDAAQWIIDQDLKLSVLGADVSLEPGRATTLRKWNSSAGTSKVAGYAIVSDYSQILSCPRLDLRATTPASLASTTTKEGPLFIGIIDVPRPMKLPELDAGTYFISWRGAGKLVETPPEEKQGISLPTQDGDEIPFHKVTGFDPEKDCYIFYSPQGVPQAAIEAPPVASQKMGDSLIAIEPFVAPDPKSLPKDAPPPIPIDTLRFTISVQSAVSNSKGFFFDLPILVGPGTFDSSWK